MAEKKTTEILPSHASLEERWDWICSFLVVQDMFVHEVLMSMHKSATRTGIETMGVQVKGSRFFLYYNPDFVKSLSDPELRFVLTHEVYHLILHHCTKRAPSDPQRAKHWNYAADLAINSLIVDDSERAMPKRKELKGVRPTDKEINFPEKLSMEQYLQLLDQKFGNDGGGGKGNQKCPNCNGTGKDPDKQDKDKQGQGNSNGQGGDEDDTCPMCGGKGKIDGLPSQGFDDHSKWEEDESGMADTMIRNLVDKLSKREKVWGSLPADIQAVIMAAQKTQVSWRKYLRYYLGQMLSSKKESTFKRPNRRFGYPYCGNKLRHVDRKLVAIDTSGSISDGDLSQFLAEVNRLAEIQPVDLVMFDWDIQGKIIPFDRKRKNFAFQGRGGTCFQPVLDIADKNRYQSLIILTDGAAAPPTKPRYVRDVLWVVVDGEPPVDWGNRVKIVTKAAQMSEAA